MDDGRKANVFFTEENEKTKVSVTFSPESENQIEMQRECRQAILNNFRRYVKSADAKNSKAYCKM